MKINVRGWMLTGAVAMIAALSVVASAQQSELTRNMGIDQKLGAMVDTQAVFRDETGKERTFGSVIHNRPVLVVPMVLKCQAGCLLLRDSLQKMLYRADHPNERKLVKREGRNRLEVGRDLDIVFLGLDPKEQPFDAADAKNAFLEKIGYNAEPVTVLTGDLANIRKVTESIGFRFFYDPQNNVLNNATGSVLITPDGHVSAYTIGNAFQTIVMERNLETAQTNAIGPKADDAEKFGCVQLAPSVIARRGKIESIYTGAGVVTLGVVIFWIGSMLRSERKVKRDLGGQPGGA